MQLSINAKKIDSRSADINFTSETILNYQMEEFRTIAKAEPMTKETAILLNLIMDMVSDQRLVASSVLSREKLKLKLESLRSRMALVNRISYKVRDMLLNGN